MLHELLTQHRNALLFSRYSLTCNRKGMLSSFKNEPLKYETLHVNSVSTSFAFVFPTATLLSSQILVSSRPDQGSAEPHAPRTLKLKDPLLWLDYRGSREGEMRAGATMSQNVRKAGRLLFSDTHRCPCSVSDVKHGNLNIH